VHARQIS